MWQSGLKVSWKSFCKFSGENKGIPIVYLNNKGNLRGGKLTMNGSGVLRKKNLDKIQVKENMRKVSVIMPVFNVEKYVGEAIESVLKQTYTDFELLLIDDHSTDTSKKICEEYKEKDSRIVLLENNSECHGPGPTRNIGIDYATGEYIYFMDSDDWVESKLLESAVNCILKTKADIVEFGVKYERSTKIVSSEYCRRDFSVITKEDIRENILEFWREKNCYLWIHFFRRNIVKGIKFEHIINGEDVSYFMDALCRARIIAYIPEVFYHYRHLEGSTCHQWVPDIIDCLEIQWIHTKKFLDSFDGKVSTLVYAEVAYFEYVWVLYQLCIKYCPLSISEKRKKLFEMKERMEFEQYRGIYPLKMQHGLMKVKYALVKYRLEWLILLIGPLFLKIVRGE